MSDCKDCKIVERPLDPSEINAGNFRTLRVPIVIQFCPLHAAAGEMLRALKEQQIRLKDLFDRHERKTYHPSSNPEDDLNLLLATGRIAIAKAEGK